MDDKKINYENNFTMKADNLTKEDNDMDTGRYDITKSTGRNQKGKTFGKEVIIVCITVAVFVILAGIRIYNLPENRLARLLDLGNAYLTEQNYEEAVLVFEQAIAIDARSIEAYFGGLEAYQHINDVEAQQTFYEKALNAVREADESFLSENMEYITTIYLQADNIYKDRTEEIVAVFEEGYQFVPENPELNNKLISAYLTMAEKYMGPESYETGLEIYDGLPGLDVEEEGNGSDLREKVNGYIDILTKEKKYDEAILVYEKVIEIDPYCAKAYICMCEAYMASEQYGKALEVIRRAQEIVTCFQTVSAYRLYSELEACIQALEKGYENTLSLGTGIQEVLGRYEGINDSIREEIYYLMQIYGDLADSIEEDIDEDDNISVQFVAEDDENLKGYKYIINAHTIEGLIQALTSFRSDVVIVLDGIEYNMEELWEFTNFFGLENVMIQGMDGTSLLCKSPSSTIADIWECKGLKLVNLIMGHDNMDFDEAEGCSAGVLDISDSEISLYNCDIFGCGLHGIFGQNSDIICENTIVRDCSERIMVLYNCNATFRKCSFSGNGYDYDRELWMPDAISVYTEKDMEVSFEDCIFRDNKNPVLCDNTSYMDPSEVRVIFSDCIFSGNTWQGTD